MQKSASSVITSISQLEYKYEFKQKKLNHQYKIGIVYQTSIQSMKWLVASNHTSQEVGHKSQL